MQNKKLEDFTDIELAETLGQRYQQLMLCQQDIGTINQEIERRKNTIAPELKDESTL